MLCNAAVQAATTGLIKQVDYDQYASHRSGLLHNLCRGARALEVSCYSAALPQLLDLLASSQISHLIVYAEERGQYGPLRSVLTKCTNITHLTCLGRFLPRQSVPSLQRLQLVRDLSEDIAARDVRALFHSLPHLRHLQHLELELGETAQLPACLADFLPPSLRCLHVRFGVPYFSGGAQHWVPDTFQQLDLAALGRCSAEMQVSLSIGAAGFCDCDGIVTSCLPRALAAVQRMHTLWLSLCAESVGALMPVLAAQLQLDAFTLCFDADQLESADFVSMDPIQALPCCGSLQLLTCGPIMRFTWAALTACPGTVFLGSKRWPLRWTYDSRYQASDSADITGFSGSLPSFSWALVVHGDLRCVEGLPHSLFSEESPGIHVIRSRAACDLDLHDVLVAE